MRSAKTSTGYTPSKLAQQQSKLQDVWLDDESGPFSPTKKNLLTPQKSRTMSDLHFQALKTPTGRTSRSQGLLNITPQKCFERKDKDGKTTETFEIGSQVIVHPFAATSAYGWLHRKTAKRFQPKDPWTHVDGLEENEKVGIITELFENEAGEMKAKLRWFARPGLLWIDGGPIEGTPEDYEPVRMQIGPLNVVFIHGSQLK